MKHKHSNNSRIIKRALVIIPNNHECGSFFCGLANAATCRIATAAKESIASGQA